MLKDRLQTLNNNIAESGDAAMTMLDNLIDGINHKDKEKFYAIEHQLEPILNAYELEITQQSIHSLALFQPEAKFLRIIITAMQINHIIERIGDIAVNIVNRLEPLIAQNFIGKDDIILMVEQTKIMFIDGLQAFQDGNYDLAKSVFDKDDIVDDLRDVVLSTMVKEMKNDTIEIDAGIRVIIAAQNIERMADMTTAIAKNTIYMIKGEFVEHK